MHLLAEASSQQIAGWFAIAGLIGTVIALLLYRVSGGYTGSAATALPGFLSLSILSAIAGGVFWWMLRKP